MISFKAPAAPGKYQKTGKELMGASIFKKQGVEGEWIQETRDLLSLTSVPEKILGKMER